ncbi:hypothetical protein BC835DRAFT_1419376 [Cytidiella melzeri]|nr:hypothetical protein BC835DRAFT_1419376 [Cytidiella melzeri]
MSDAHDSEQPQPVAQDVARTTEDDAQISSTHPDHPPLSTAGNVIDSSPTHHDASIAAPAQQDTPPLPPRPQQSMATHTHIADELPPPTTDDHPQQTHPSVAQLKAMFPDFDDSLLEEILASVNYNEDAAIDVLLGMSDPSYVSAHPPSAAPPQPTSMELDEALARQLQLEDDRQVRDRAPQRATGESWSRRSADRGSGDVEVSYATRAGQPHPSSAQPQGQGQGSDFNEIRETFTQIAESGKRTFSSIFSKVKAKINELDTSRPTQAHDQHPPPSWGATSSTPGQPYGSQGMDRHAASQYYGGSQPHGTAPADEGWTKIGGGPPPTVAVTTPPSSAQPPTYSVPQPQATRGYDIDDNTHTPPHPTSISIPTPAAALSSSPPSSSTNPETPRPPTTQTGSPLNITKLGLLPKRPVSLLTPQSSATAATRREGEEDDEDEDEDELDYVENPFEDRKISQ